MSRRTNIKQQSNKIKCLINHGLDVPNSSPHILTSFVNDDDDDNEISSSEIVKDAKDNRKTVSEQIFLMPVDEVKSPLLRRVRELPNRVN